MRATRARPSGTTVADLDALLVRFEAGVADLAAALTPPLHPDWVARAGAAKALLDRLRPDLQKTLRGVSATVRVPRSEAEDAPPSTPHRRALELATGGSARRAVNALRRWTGVSDLLRRATGQGELALYPAWGPRDLMPGQMRAFDSAFGLIDRLLASPAQDRAAAEQGFWPDIRLRPSDFLTHAHVAWRLLAAQGRLGAARFLDVGCGAGTKLALAAGLFPDVTGLEFDPGYAAAARALAAQIRPRPAGVLDGDALTFDGYADFDVIYFFQPIRVQEKLQQLEERICRRARPGTVLIAPYSGFATRVEGFGATHVAGCVSVAGLDSEAAALWSAAARAMGPDLTPPEELTPHSDEGLWAPVLHALRLAGFSGARGEG